MNSQHSLSVVLPVHNGAGQLAGRVGRLLECLADITASFEVLILDNGSTDESEEVAYELVHDFPQLRVARHAARQPEAEIIRTGLQQTSGELVIIYDEGAGIRAHELRRMWALRHDRQLVIARSDDRQPGTLLERLAEWASQIPGERGSQTTDAGLQIIRRRAIEEFESKPAQVRRTPAGPRARRPASVSGH